MYKQCRIFLLLIMMLGAYAVGAQQNKLIYGSVFAGNTLRPISGAKITNLSSRQVTTSNMLGTFAITTRPGDSLFITKDGYAPLTTVADTQKFMIVKIQKNIMLNQVTVLGASKKQEQAEVVNEYRSKGIYYNGKPPLSAYLPVSGKPLTVLHELFGTDVKREKRFMRVAENERQTIEINRRFNSILISKTTGLKGDSLNNFIDTYRPNYSVLKKWSDYDLVVYIRKSFNNYKIDYKFEKTDSFLFSN